MESDGESQILYHLAVFSGIKTGHGKIITDHDAVCACCQFQEVEFSQSSPAAVDAYFLVG